MINERRRALLIIDGDISLHTRLARHFKKADYTVLTASHYESAIDTLRRYKPPVVIQNLVPSSARTSSREHLNIASQVRSISSNTRLLVVAEAGSDQAIHAASIGAYDIFSHPVNLDLLNIVVSRAFQMWDLEQLSSTRKQRALSRMGEFLAADPETLNICERLGKIATSDVSCLLRGESGTGKELLARAMHSLSARRKGPFVAINCAALPEALVESELFGHEKGAFTDANQTRIGRVELAQNGTLLLDEIGDMPLPAQAKVLRFIQERAIERVGGRTGIPVNTRIVCATNRNLQNMVQEGTFREDLYYRIAEVDVEIPGLRERGDDKLLLALHFLDKLACELGCDKMRFDASALASIETYPWPGNVRELINKVRNGIVMAETRIVTAQDLGFTVGPTFSLNLREIRSAAERSAVLRTLAAAEGNITTAAHLLGVTRPTFYNLLKRHGIYSEEFRMDEATERTIASRITH